MDDVKDRFPFIPERMADIIFLVGLFFITVISLMIAFEVL